MNPDFVSPGNPLKASWANDVVTAIRSTTNDPTVTRGGAKRIFKPFDPISLEREGATWYLKIQEAVYFEAGNSDSTPILYGATALSDYPRLTIPANKDLYFNYKTKQLVWADSDILGNLKILQFTYTGDLFKIRNLHPGHIDLRAAPPFTPLFSNTSGTYSVALTPGYVCERSAINSDAITNHAPINFSSHQTIASGQQVTIKVAHDNRGTVVYPSGVTCIVEGIGPASIHYAPPGGDDQAGTSGDYHYGICSLASSFTRILAGSHIDHFAEVPCIDNTVVASGSGYARVLKDYNADKFNLRVLKQKSGSQLKVLESADSMDIGGNEVAGNLFAKFGSDSPTSLTVWEDGLTITPGDVTLAIPSYLAGSGISIDGPVDNVYTINATESSGSSPSGQNGYIYLVANHVSDNLAGLFVRIEDGLITQIEDAYPVLPDVSEWGSILFTLYLPEFPGPNNGGAFNMTWL